MARPLAVVGAAAAAGTALYYLIKSRRNLAGSWYSVAKATGAKYALALGARRIAVPD